MKIRRCLTLMCAGICCLAFLPAQAQEIDNRGSVYLGGIHYMFDDDRLLEDDTGVLLGIELPFAERWSMAFEHADFFAAETQQGAGDADLRYTRVGINYQLDWIESPRFQPYVGVGFGGLGINRPLPLHNNYDTTLDVGIGLKQSLTDHVQLRWDLKSINPDGFNSNDLAFSLSVAYAFGNGPGSAPPVVATPEPEPEPVDADNDGVLDINDACLETSPNRPVDARGCELDSDADGVADLLDNCPNTPEDLAVDGNGCPILETTLLRQTLDIRFEYDAATIRPEFTNNLAEFAEFLNIYGNTAVVIEGHTDSMGSENYNQDLSERRAMAVRNSLVNDFNITADRVSIIGYGESRPVATNDTEAGRTQNRRIEAEVSVTVEEEVQR